MPAQGHILGQCWGGVLVQPKSASVHQTTPALHYRQQQNFVLRWNSIPSPTGISCCFINLFPSLFINLGIFMNRSQMFPINIESEILFCLFIIKKESNILKSAFLVVTLKCLYWSWTLIRKAELPLCSIWHLGQDLFFFFIFLLLFLCAYKAWLISPPWGRILRGGGGTNKQYKASRGSYSIQTMLGSQHFPYNSVTGKDGG
jgi:hypothetical protein